MKFNKHGVAKTFKFESLSDRNLYNTSLLGYVGAFIGVAVGLSTAIEVIEKINMKQDEV